MSILFNALTLLAIPGAIAFVGYSFYHIRHASKTPCNGEVKQLAHLDGTIAKFHRVVKQNGHPKGTMQHS